MARRVLHDSYFKKAKAEGYAARSAYKLKQINERFNLILGDDRVLDLGCAPGSWMQVAREILGESGIVVGIDLKPVSVKLPAPDVAYVGDLFTFDARRLTAPARGEFDVVLSDMAPDTSGAGDHFASANIVEKTLDILPTLLRPGGRFAIKLFDGERTGELMNRVRRAFDRAHGFKPHATRQVSREMYLVGIAYRPHKDRLSYDAAPPPGVAGPRPPVVEGWSARR